MRNEAAECAAKR